MKILRNFLTLAALALLLLAAPAHAFTWAAGTFNQTTDTLSWVTPADIVTINCPAGTECDITNLHPPTGQAGDIRIMNLWTACNPLDRNCVAPQVFISSYCDQSGCQNVDTESVAYTLNPRGLIELISESSGWAVQQ